MDGPELQISNLSNVADLYTGEITGRAWTISESLAVYVSKDDRQRFVEIELLDSAETLLPHFLPEQVGDAWNWMPIAGTQKVSYNRDRDILRLFNDKPPVASRYIAGNLTVGCDDKGHPVCVELAGAAR